MEAERLAGIEEFYLKPALLTNPEGVKLAQKTGVKPLPKTKTLEELRQEVINCKQCPLYKTRKNPVFGEGSPGARLVFVGEAPGRDEDLKGEPFVGRAGKLLDKILEAIQFSRDNQVYIANILKCRQAYRFVSPAIPAAICCARSCAAYMITMLKNSADPTVILF